jgi:hypothetical protein
LQHIRTKTAGLLEKIKNWQNVHGETLVYEDVSALELVKSELKKTNLTLAVPRPAAPSAVRVPASRAPGPGPSTGTGTGLKRAAPIGSRNPWVTPAASSTVNSSASGTSRSFVGAASKVSGEMRFSIQLPVLD